MIISLENLSSGLAWCCSESKWGRDLANSEYEGISADRTRHIFTTQSSQP
jgi:hypothetical protein